MLCAAVAPSSSNSSAVHADGDGHYSARPRRVPEAGPSRGRRRRGGGRQAEVPEAGVRDLFGCPTPDRATTQRHRRRRRRRC
uniref:Uncharacterized protein n=1 Tax=Arundo donax TaxID=35708 RepID=A0A0A8YQL2_ARUDO